MNPTMIRLIPLLILLLLSAVLASGLFTNKDEMFRKRSLVGLEMVPFSVPTLGSDQPRFSPRDWQGKVVILNIFASWCKPCIAEHKIWMDIAKQGKANIYGMAWKDSPEDVSKWLTTHGNPYHLLGIDQQGDTTLQLGLTGVPETFILGPTGSIFFHHQAPVTKELAETVILPLVEKITSGELQAEPRTMDSGMAPPAPGSVPVPAPAAPATP